MARKPGVDEFPAEELIRRENRQHIQFPGGELYCDEWHTNRFRPGACHFCLASREDLFQESAARVRHTALMATERNTDR